MGAILADNILELRIYSQMRDQMAVNTFHLKATGIVGTPTEEDFLVRLQTQPTTLYANCIAAEAAIYGWTVRVAGPPGFAVAAKVFVFSPPVPGAQSFEVLPGQVRGIISLRGNAKGPKGRGRLYFPWPTRNNLDSGGRPTAVQVDRYRAWGEYVLRENNVWIFNGGSITTTPCTLPRKPKGGGPAPDPVILTNRVYPVRFATQRRSGAYGRANPPFAS